jgi:hypothetical protein
MLKQTSNQQRHFQVENRFDLILIGSMCFVSLNNCRQHWKKLNKLVALKKNCHTNQTPKGHDY